MKKRKKGRKKAHKIAAITGKPVKVHFERPDINMRTSVVVVPEFPAGDPKARIVRSPSGSNSIYKVVFVLSIPGKELFKTHVDTQSLSESGESLLLVPHGTHTVKADLFNDKEIVQVFFFPNASGSLAKAEVRIAASSFQDAESKASDLVLPIISWWSYRYDVALDVSGCEIAEENTDVRKWIYGILGKPKMLDLNSGVFSKPEFRTLFAAYREGVNSTNAFYQFLCYYKAIEGVRKLRSERRRAQTSAQTEPPERFPQQSADIGIAPQWGLEFFTPYLGKKFAFVLDEFRDLLRNAIAHLDPLAGSLLADRYEDFATCYRAIPVVKYMARELIKNELTAAGCPY